MCATHVRDANGSRLRGQDDDGHENDGLQRRYCDVGIEGDGYLHVRMQEPLYHS